MKEREYKAKIKELIEQGKSLSQMAYELGTTNYMLERYIKRHGMAHLPYKSVVINKQQKQFLAEHAPTKTINELSIIIYGDTEKKNVGRIRRYLDRNKIEFKKKNNVPEKPKPQPKVIIRFKEEKVEFKRPPAVYSNPQWA